MTARAISSTEVLISWACPDCLNTTNGFAVTIALTSPRRLVTRNVTKETRKVTQTGLRKFASYAVWVQQGTPWGLGTRSAPAAVRTFEDGKDYGKRRAVHSSAIERLIETHTTRQCGFRNRGNTYLTSLPLVSGNTYLTSLSLVSLRRHGHVTR